MKNSVTSTSLEQTETIARDILNKIMANKTGATVLALQGNLGSGKTTFAQAVARELGIAETVTSPTFVIQKNYEIKNPKFAAPFKKLIHIDAYRIEDPSELETIGFKKLTAEPRNLILVEWPEKMAVLLPAETKTICFKFINETTREISW